VASVFMPNGGWTVRDRGTAGLGIRAKLNLGVGIVVLVSALAFGGLYALVERAAVLGEKHHHLVHVASMARLSFEGRGGDALHEEIVEFNRHLSEATGAPHQIWIVDAAGRTLVGSDISSNAARVHTDDTGLWSSLFPSSMAGEIPIRMGLGAASARLIVEGLEENYVLRFRRP
jgi:hypothetical protein